MLELIDCKFQICRTKSFKNTWKSDCVQLQQQLNNKYTWTLTSKVSLHPTSPDCLSLRPIFNWVKTSSKTQPLKESLIHGSQCFLSPRRLDQGLPTRSGILSAWCFHLVRKMTGLGWKGQRQECENTGGSFQTWQRRLSKVHRKIGGFWC